MKNIIKWIMFTLCILLFLILSILVLKNDLNKFDNAFYQNLMMFKNIFLTSYFKYITKFADNYIIILFSLYGLIILWKDKMKALYLISLTSISTIINLTLKLIIARERPININLITETGYSFPSGHSMASVTFYGFIIYLINKSKINLKLKLLINTLLIFLIINICISRVYLGVHYISDVIAGASLSIILLILGIHYIEKRGVRKNESINNRSK